MVMIQIQSCSHIRIKWFHERDWLKNTQVNKLCWLIHIVNVQFQPKILQWRKISWLQFNLNHNMVHTQNQVIIISESLNQSHLILINVRRNVLYQSENENLKKCLKRRTEKIHSKVLERRMCHNWLDRMVCMRKLWQIMREDVRR